LIKKTFDPYFLLARSIILPYFICTMPMNMAEIITSGLKLFSLSSCSSFQNFSSQKYFLNFKIHKTENSKKNRKKYRKINILT